jgi:amino acid transporter
VDSPQKASAPTTLIYSLKFLGNVLLYGAAAAAILAYFKIAPSETPQFISRFDVWAWLAIIFGCLAVGLTAFNSYRVIQQAPKETIRFDYLPDSPLNADWQRAYGDVLATFEKDRTVRGALKMVVTGGYFAMDYRIPPTLPCDRLRFSAKYTNDTMIFTQVEVTKDKKLTSRTVWIKYYVGSKPAQKYKPDSNEMTIWVMGKALDGGGWNSTSTCGRPSPIHGVQNLGTLSLLEQFA